MAVFMTPVEITPALTGWQDADVSSYVPIGATGIILHIVNTSTTNERAIGFRMNGSTDSRTTNMGATQHFWCAVGIDSNGIVELNVTSTTGQDIYLVGYFKTDAAFFTNAPNKTPGALSSFVDVDISTDTGTDTAIAAVLELISPDGTAASVGVRKNGSSDTRNSSVSYHIGAIIGVDASKIFEAYLSSANAQVWLLGYIRALGTFNTNALDRDISTTGAWTNLGDLPVGALGGVYEVVSRLSTTATYGLRTQGSTENIVRRSRSHTFGIIEGNAGKVEGQISDTGVDIWEIGAFFSGAEILAGIIDGVSSVTGALTVAGGAIELAGTISGQSDATASLLLTVPLEGMIQGTATVEGSLDASISITGASQGLSTASGTPRMSRRVMGLTPGMSSLAGILKVNATVEGTATGVSDLTVSLSRVLALAGSIESTATDEGTLSLSLPIHGTTAATSIAIGDITIEAGLKGVVGASATVSGSLGADVLISGAMSGNAEATGLLGVMYQPSGFSVAVSELTAGLSVTISERGNIEDTSSLAGILERQRGIHSSAGTTVVITGKLKSTLPMLGNVIADSGANADLSAAVLLNGSIEVTCATSGSISTSIAFRGQVGVTTGMTGVLTGQAVLASIIAETSQVSGTLQEVGDISGIIEASSQVEASLLLVVGTSGTIEDISGLSAFLGRARQIPGSIPGAAGLDGFLSMQDFLRGQVQAVGSSLANLEVGYRLYGATGAASEVEAFMNRNTPITGLATARSEVLGRMTIQQLLYIELVGRPDINRDILVVLDWTVS